MFRHHDQWLNKVLPFRFIHGILRLLNQASGFELLLRRHKLAGSYIVSVMEAMWHTKDCLDNNNRQAAWARGKTQLFGHRPGGLAHAISNAPTLCAIQSRT